MRENQSDISALQHGLKSRRPARDGLRLYTADFDSVSLARFYRGRSAFLILSGPSLNQVDLSLLNRRGIVTMGVNNSWTIHRPSLWTCVDDPGRFIDTGWKDPGILKIVPTCMWSKRLRIQTTDRHGGVTMRDSAFKVHQMPSVLFFRRADHFDHERFLTGDSIPWGNDGKTADSLGIVGKRSVMLVALRLLHYLGFGTVYLLGCDFKTGATPSTSTAPGTPSATTTCSTTRSPGASRPCGRTSTSTSSAWSTARRAASCGRSRR